MPAVLNDDRGGAIDARVAPSSNPLARSLLVTRTSGVGHHVNVVLLEFNPAAMFAGVKTALETAALLGTLTGRQVRLVLLRPISSIDMDRQEFIDVRRAALKTAFEFVDWDVVCQEDLETASFGTDDIWVATHWMTAHALDIASRAGGIDASRVIYLVQDYEPDFFAGASDRSAAESTYRAGFTLLVNSRQVAAFLKARGIAVDESHVFSPQFDSRQLRLAASRRTVEAAPVIFFYGRPATPRNLFSLGVEVLQRASEVFAQRGSRVAFVMAGADGPDVDLAKGFTLRNLGVLERDAYFEEISKVDVGLTLQATPHPSHLPFDLAISGAFAVTNEVDGSRNEMHPRIIAAPSTPAALSASLVAMLDRSRSLDRMRLGYLPVREGQLGTSLKNAVMATIGHAHLL